MTSFKKMSSGSHGSSAFMTPGAWNVFKQIWNNSAKKYVLFGKNIRLAKYLPYYGFCGFLFQAPAWVIRFRWQYAIEISFTGITSRLFTHVISGSPSASLSRRPYPSLLSPSAYHPSLHTWLLYFHMPACNQVWGGWLLNSQPPRGCSRPLRGK